MKPLFRSFGLFIRQIAADAMLVAVILAPLLAGLFFRFGIPQIEILLCGYFNTGAILSPYYLLFDLLLCMITPYMFCFASAMVMLTEYDENMACYLAVTPVGKSGYILSRLGFPALISFVVSLPLVLMFSLTRWNLLFLVLTCLVSSLTSVAVALLLFSLSRNRVEGMAVAKMAGLFMLGMPVPFFLHSPVQYLFALLPSFWSAKLCIEQNVLFIIPALVSVALWLWPLYLKFKRKLA